METNRVYWTLLNYRTWQLYIAATKEGLCYIGSQQAPFEELASWVEKQLPAYSLSEDAEEMKTYVNELLDYLKGKRKEFSLRVDLHGTPFQQSVWSALQEIPFGQTVTYSDIAERIQRPQSVRAVGTAIGANPVLMTVPCHRVIGKSGKLTGYRGGLEMKKRLLELERKGSAARV